jgi:hypothetical protein
VIAVTRVLVRHDSGASFGASVEIAGGAGNSGGEDESAHG